METLASYSKIQRKKETWASTSNCLQNSHHFQLLVPNHTVIILTGFKLAVCVCVCVCVYTQIYTYTETIFHEEENLY